MAVKKTLDEKKLSMAYTKGSATYGRVKESATDEQMFAVGKAISSVAEETLQTVYVIEEYTLVNEG